MIGVNVRSCWGIVLIASACDPGAGRTCDDFDLRFVAQENGYAAVLQRDPFGRPLELTTLELRVYGQTLSTSRPDAFVYDGWSLDDLERAVFTATFQERSGLGRIADCPGSRSGAALQGDPPLATLSSVDQSLDAGTAAWAQVGVPAGHLHESLAVVGACGSCTAPSTALGCVSPLSPTTTSFPITLDVERTVADNLEVGVEADRDFHLRLQEGDTDLRCLDFTVFGRGTTVPSSLLPSPTPSNLSFIAGANTGWQGCEVVTTPQDADVLTVEPILPASATNGPWSYTPAVPGVTFAVTLAPATQSGEVVVRCTDEQARSVSRAWTIGTAPSDQASATLTCTPTPVRTDAQAVCDGTGFVDGPVQLLGSGLTVDGSNQTQRTAQGGEFQVVATGFTEGTTSLTALQNGHSSTFVLRAIGPLVVDPGPLQVVPGSSSYVQTVTTAVSASCTAASVPTGWSLAPSSDPERWTIGLVGDAAGDTPPLDVVCQDDEVGWMATVRFEVAPPE
jgi:hypothetical protein